MSLGFYLYGILPAPFSEKVVLEGLDRQPVQSYSVDGFNFLYSEAKKEKYRLDKLSGKDSQSAGQKLGSKKAKNGGRVHFPTQFIVS